MQRALEDGRSFLVTTRPSCICGAVHRLRSRNYLTNSKVSLGHRHTGRQSGTRSTDQESSKHQTLSGVWGRPYVFRKLAQLDLTWFCGLASARLHRAAAAALRSGRGPVVRMLTRGRTAPSEATAAAMSRRLGQYIRAWRAPDAAACCCTLPVRTHNLTRQDQRNSTTAHDSAEMFGAHLALVRSPCHCMLLPTQQGRDMRYVLCSWDEDAIKHGWAFT